ncbi:hypothetical protein SPV1_12997 [Mariprofundus ferrooxydans PV-1]|uniref:Uncharacterized protein n=1 Tax=Mariprofundus ferrooxydans PV-1 TaxID=314345 RepID=Q0EW00_9PROT|nr:hypothetical protein SPV1_12997 [Mariprofundus ferrooxydans PV-1]
MPLGEQREVQDSRQAVSVDRSTG